MTLAKAIPQLTAALSAMGGRRDVDLFIVVGDSRAVAQGPDPFTPAEAEVGRWIFRDNLDPDRMPRRVRRENIQGRASWTPDFVQRLYDLTGREALILNIAKSGACLVKEADDANPDLHWDVTDLDGSLLGALSGQPNDRSSILPLTNALIDLCPGWRVGNVYVISIMGTWDSAELEDGTVLQATYVDRLHRLVDYLGAAQTFLCLPVVEGADLATAQANVARLDAVRSAQRAAANRADIHVVLDIPGQPSEPYETLVTNPDGTWVSGWSTQDGLHEDEDATACMGIMAAEAIATIIGPP